MGMAASQARFLQLTARKTNLEYMGQQINQERLALANESAGLFEKQLTMVPPTPPSSLDDSYYSPAYTFTDPQDGIQKKIEISFPTSTTMSFSTSYSQYNPDGSYTENTTLPWGTLGTFTETWNSEGTEVTGVTLASATADNWYIDTTMTAGNSENFVDSATGRVKKIVIVQASAATTAYSDQIHTVDLTYSPVFDEDAFNDDMNKYEYEKATYDYEVERINLETERIQRQDKSLELKLKQIDTEHNAIQTEMDAVQKVIQKNVESSFKTFS